MPHYSSRPIFVNGGGAGGAGNSLEFDWDGTKLGVRVEGDEEYEYVDLKGDKGNTGSAGADGKDGEQGPQGEPGADGKDGVDGEQGPAGKDGADGFPSEEEWNALVARVEELEGGEEA